MINRENASRLLAGLATTSKEETGGWERKKKEKNETMQR